MRQGDAGPFSMRVETASDGAVRIEAEKVDNSPVSNLVLRVTGNGHAMDVPMTQTDASLYRGELGQLPRGKYTAALMIKGGDTERRSDAARVRLYRHRVGRRRRSANPAAQSHLAEEPRGRDRRRLEVSAAEVLKPSGMLITVHRSAEGFLLPLAIVLFLGEVFVRRRFLGD